MIEIYRFRWFVLMIGLVCFVVIASGCGKKKREAIRRNAGSTDTTSSKGVERDPEEERLYMEARQKELFRKYTESTKLYTELIAKFPESDLADDAQFGIAQNYELGHVFDAAVFEYLKLAREYPDSPRCEDAYFKAAKIHFQRREPERGKAVFRQYLKQFPDGKHAAEAKRVLGMR